MIGRVQGSGGLSARAIVSLRGAGHASRSADPVDHVEPVAPVARMTSLGFDRRAEFLAQLIAMRDGFPQARERRRAAPADAIRAYRETADLDDAIEAEYDEVV